MESKLDLGRSLDLPEFDDHEREVLGILTSGRNTYFSFQGLRRMSGLHQETLARTLRRLEEADVIERSPDGYRMIGAGSQLTFTVNSGNAYAKPVIDAYLPVQVEVTVLFQKLRGRWFSDFRWLGYSRDGNAFSMSWVSDDGALQIQARIGQGKIEITADSRKGTDDPLRIAAAYQLFDHVTKIAEEMLQDHPPSPAN